MTGYLDRHALGDPGAQAFSPDLLARRPGVTDVAQFFEDALRDMERRWMEKLKTTAASAKKLMGNSCIDPLLVP